MSLVFGFGENDADYVVRKRVNGKTVTCKAYQAWVNMLSRVYNEKSRHVWITYTGSSVCDEWRSFMKFKGWYDENFVDGWHIDKDVLSDCRVYSPESCIFIPVWINNFITRNRREKFKLPIGVYFDKRTKKYQAHCYDSINKKQECIGRFSSKEEAHNEWKKKKLEVARTLRGSMDSIDIRIYGRIIEIIETS